MRTSIGKKQLWQAYRILDQLWYNICKGKIMLLAKLMCGYLIPSFVEIFFYKSKIIMGIICNWLWNCKIFITHVIRHDRGHYEYEIII